MDLTKEDYIQILNYYNIPIKKTATSYVKTLAEKIIAKKTCTIVDKDYTMIFNVVTHVIHSRVTLIF